MGYTHYWKNGKEINTDTWRKITEDFKKILKVIPSDIKMDGCFKGKDVFISDQEICFNGIDELSHETFLVSRQISDFDFCKTAAKPYDLAACCCLLITSFHCDSFSYSSDGGSEEWEDSISLVNNTLNLKISFSD